MPGTVVHQHDAIRSPSQTVILYLAEREIQIAIVVNVHEAVPDVPPVVRRIVAEHGIRRAVTLDLELTAAVVDHEVADDVLPACALNPKVQIPVTVNVACGRSLDVKVSRCGEPFAPGGP